MKSSREEEVLKWHRLVEFNIKGREPPSAKADTSSGRMLVFRLIPLTPIERGGSKDFCVDSLFSLIDSSHIDTNHYTFIVNSLNEGGIG